VPGRRDRNLRQGDLAEQLGLLLLQNLALVAPIPRTEDVGIDAVVTLLRTSGARELWASDSFLVQIKADSVESIEYTGAECDWLYGLELPLFVASVNLARNEVRLYCCHRLSQAFVTNRHRQRIEIVLGDKLDPSPDVAGGETTMSVGPPVLRWTIDDCREPDFQRRFYECCKEHVRLGRESLEYRRVGHANLIRWRTNELPERVGFITSSEGAYDDEIEHIADHMMPYVDRLLDESLRRRDAEWLEELQLLVGMRLIAVRMLQSDEARVRLTEADKHVLELYRSRFGSLTSSDGASGGTPA